MRVQFAGAPPMDKDFARFSRWRNKRSKARSACRTSPGENQVEIGTELKGQDVDPAST